MKDTLSLDGTWQLCGSDGIRGHAAFTCEGDVDPALRIDATVPGDVHLDLMRAGLLADPAYGTNVLSARWVEECLWKYTRTFDAPAAAAAAAARAWLVFEGLDLAAEIFLNGVSVGRHENAHRPCRLEVTGKMLAGVNRLTVRINSGLFSVADKPIQAITFGPDAPLHKRNWLRKPQCQFGWDWGPRLLNVGIFKPVRLEWTAAPFRADQLVPMVEFDPDLASGRVRARLFVEGLAEQPVEGVLRAEIPELNAAVAADVTLRPGLHACEVALRVANPQPWWPVGHGPQKRYDLKVTLTAGGVSARQTARIGFRRVRINQDPHPLGGRRFHIEINGRKVFAKGANFVPADLFFARLDRQRYAPLIALAREANFNFLRVWGGGLYENDAFYDLCDEAGIMVWQDFAFACARYPLHDEPFYRNVLAEAAYNVRRLARHPSLIVWCGNNEVEQGTWHWRYDTGHVYPDYALFHLALPRLLAQEDPTRFYWPSSPFSPDGLDPMRDDTGDQHPWRIGFTQTDVRGYRDMACRFADEGGTLGTTALPTIRGCLPAGQQARNSFSWRVHDNSVSMAQDGTEPGSRGNPVRTYLGRDPDAMDLETYAYFRGLYQAEGLREHIENFRRRMFDSAAAVFWMYNDNWPATQSWSIVDACCRRTSAFHAVRRAMAPVHVVIARQDDTVCVYGINDTPVARPATLRYGLFTIDGTYVMDRRADVTLPPSASTVLASFPADTWQDPLATPAFAVLEHQGEVLARNRLMLPVPRDMRWTPAAVNVRVDDGRAVFSSEGFAWGVCLDLDGETALADNFFDVYPGQPYSIAWPHAEPPRILFTANAPPTAGP